MEKTVVAPGFGEVDSEEIDETQFALAVATGREGHRRVEVSGLGWNEGDVAEQTRSTLDLLERILVDLGGTMDDVTMMRWYVDGDVLSRETQTRLHEVRAEFFERPHYPASTMVGVAGLLGDGMLVEIEAEAEIPDDGWTVDAIEDGDDGGGGDDGDGEDETADDGRE